MIFSTILLLYSIIHLKAQPHFTTHQLDNNSHGTVSLFSIDLDLDNDIDIITAATEDNQVIWWRNNGGSPLSWTKIIIASNFFGAKSVYAGDIDGDGDNDIVACASDAAQIAIWINTGTNQLTFEKQVVRNNYLWAHEVYLTDIDSDGDLDILAASSSLNQISLFTNLGGSPIIWEEKIIGDNFTQAKSVTAGDIDNDGLVDIAAASLLENQIAWWKNNSDNSWTKQIISSSFAGAHRVQLVDIDKDGWLDILASGWYANEIAWWKNSGGTHITWSKQIIGSNFMRTCVAYSIDIDNDGNNDVIGTAQDGDHVAVWINDGGQPISWTKLVIDNNFDRVWPLHANDLDNDGDIDIIAGSGHQGNDEIRWYENLLNTSGILIEQIYAPAHFSFYQNYPNPFNPETTIEYYIPETSIAQISIFNSVGEKVAELLNEIKNEGYHNIKWNGSDFSSGVYFVRLTSYSLDNNYSVQKIVKAILQK
jgi:hypothetical protein